MATVLLQAVGTAVGGMFGGPLGAVAGRALGAFAGSQIDQQLFGAGDKTISGPRLESVQALSSREGASIPQVFGRARVAGEIIWATRFEEVQTTESHSAGGKGAPPKTTVKSFSYFANFAVGLCQGPIACVRRIWADGKLLQNHSITMRVYNGNDSQRPDSLIEAKQGRNNAPAYRGLAYVVFEKFPLEKYGNRIPQIAIEVIRPIGDLEKNIRAVNMIPGATEFGYDTEPVVEEVSSVESRSLNVHQTVAETDFLASLDELVAICPGLEQVALVVTWFGDDLRAGQCKIQPCVETSSRKLSEGSNWSVGGLNRSQARLVSRIDGSPAYGGTPSDASVVRAIKAIKSKGLKVCLNPFVMMDVAAGNSLSSPYGGQSQEVYPWRGRITCHPARGQAQTVDGTSTAALQIQSFVGEAQLNEITLSGDRIFHHGLSEWSYRRFILHYVRLAQLVGGVDMFLIGSEFRGLTSVRDQSGAFPFVDALMAIADEAKSVLGSSCKVTYGADWSEYFGFQPADTSGDVFYNLDKLWASGSIDVVGIDNYMPLSDWRSTGEPEDAGRNACDSKMLAGNVQAGEGYDWYYATSSDRKSGSRTPITDGSGKPWIYRYKDLKSWWSNYHTERRGGVELSANSPWVPQSKPIIFTEFGCPAIHNGPAQPNVFYDPKSSESAFPYFSSGGRDDQALVSYIQAHQRHWEPSNEHFDNANNPVSNVYSGRMVDFSLSQLWAWDARPFPAFPSRDDVWSDGGNWRTGHWLNGRLGGVRLADLISELLKDSGIKRFDVSAVYGTFDGYLIAEIESVRKALEVLISLFQLAVFEDRDILTFRSPGHDQGLVIPHESMVFANDEAVSSFTSEQEEELPTVASLNHLDPSTDFQNAESNARRINGGVLRHQQLSAPIICEPARMLPVLEGWLHDRWISRDTVSFTLPKTYLNLTVGDEVLLDQSRLAQRWRIVSIEESETLRISAKAVETSQETSASSSDERKVTPALVTFSAPFFRLLDLPYLTMNGDADSNRIVAASVPWPGPLAVYSSPSTDGYIYRQSVDIAGFVGHLVGEASGCGTTSRWSRSDVLEIRLSNGSLSSVDQLRVLNGANALALKSRTGSWEILQFCDAELVADSQWSLSNLLRGQAGTEAEALAGSEDSAEIVVLNQAVVPLENAQAERGLELNWMVGPVGSVLGDPEFTHATQATGYRGLMPFCPVHLKHSTASNGDLRVSWIRRNRIAGDDWNAVEIPNHEENESYQVSLLDQDGGRLARTFTEPAAEFSTLELKSKFGGGKVDLTVEVSQISAVTGPGAKAGIEISINL